MENVKKFRCLTCSNLIKGTPVNSDSCRPPNAISNRTMLKLFVPEWIINDEVSYKMCMNCNCKLSTGYYFRLMCLTAMEEMKKSFVITNDIIEPLAKSESTVVNKLPINKDKNVRVVKVFKANSLKEIPASEMKNIQTTLKKMNAKLITQKEITKAKACVVTKKVVKMNGLFKNNDINDSKSDEILLNKNTPPEINLSETIVHNWKKNISSLVNKDFMKNNAPTVIKIEKVEDQPMDIPEMYVKSEHFNTCFPETDREIENYSSAETNSNMKTNEQSNGNPEEQTVSKPIIEMNSNSIINNKLSKFAEKHSLDEETEETNFEGEETILKCNHCGLLLTSKDTLITHIRQHFNKNPLECKLCHAQFSDDSAYNKHTCKRKIDSDDTAECSSLEKSLKDTTVVLPLISDLETECLKPKECKCNLYFSNSDTLKIHLRTTCNNNTFCSACNVGFIDEMSMERHLRNIHSLCVCNICKKMFRNKNSLMKHLLLMHEKNISDVKQEYACQLVDCRMQFHYQQTYDMHMTYKHQKYYSITYTEDSEESYVTYHCCLCDREDIPFCMDSVDRDTFICQFKGNHAL